MLLNDVVLSVEEVLFQSEAAHGLEPIEVSATVSMAGDVRKSNASEESRTPDFAFRYPIATGERRVFFLARRSLPLTNEVGPVVWWGARGGGSWFITDKAIAYPTLRSLNEDIRESDSLPGGARPASVSRGTTGLSMGDLRRVIQALR